MIKVFLIYCVAGLVVFANGLSGPFMLDDHAFFTPQIKDVRRLGEHFVPRRYKSSVPEKVPHGQPNFYYRPFAKVLPSIAYALFGQKVFFYHLMNLLLLATAGFLLFKFLVTAQVLDHRGAFLSGLLYIAHPINGVMVNYITASVFSAQVGFMLGSLNCLMGPQRPGAPTSQTNRSRGSGALENWGSIIFFILALMCHETAVLLPLCAAIFIYVYDAKGPIQDRLRVCLGRTWFMWIVTAAWLIFRLFYASLGDGLIAKFARFEMNPLEYAASVGKLTAWYLSKLIVPWDIVLIWATPVVRGSELTIWVLFGVLLLVLWVFFYNRIKDKTIRLGLLWLATGFLPLPLMCLFQPAHGPMIEPHWFVFSSTGFFICLARCSEMTTATPGVAAVLVLCLLVAGWRQNSFWADEKRYAHYWSEQAPSIKAVWFHLGEIYFKERRFPEAVRYYERSVRRTYQDYLAYQRMGLAYFQAGDLPRAYVNFMVSLDIEPRQPGIRERLKWIEDRRAIE